MHSSFRTYMLYYYTNICYMNGYNILFPIYVFLILSGAQSMVLQRCIWVFFVSVDIFYLVEDLQFLGWFL